MEVMTSEAGLSNVELHAMKGLPTEWSHFNTFRKSLVRYIWCDRLLGLLGYG